jgi:hypothetical protein
MVIQTIREKSMIGRHCHLHRFDDVFELLYARHYLLYIGDISCVVLFPLRQIVAQKMQLRQQIMLGMLDYRLDSLFKSSEPFADRAVDHFYQVFPRYFGLYLEALNVRLSRICICLWQFRGRQALIDQLLDRQ